MQIEELCKEYGLPEAVSKIIGQAGIHSLYPPQVAAIKKGVLNGKSLTLAIPTAAGKTLIAELCMLKAILEKGGHCLYIVPLRALASEKYEDFKAKYSTLGISVGIATGDFDLPSHYLSKYQILIATSEKVDSLLRFRAKWLTETLNVAVLDEIHYIDDSGRGPTLEILISRLKQLNPKIQFLALSATIANAQEIADWLKSDYVNSSWRPVPLKEGVFYNERIRFSDETYKLLRDMGSEVLAPLVRDVLDEKGQALIFVNSRRSTQAVAKDLQKTVHKYVAPQEKILLEEIAKSILGAKDEATKICHKLSECVRHGVAFHHAGLHYHQRRLIEDAFKKNLVKVICSTPTLAAGVNLPARRVIVRDIKRYEAGLGSAYIPTFEYKQCAGRAGRPQYDSFGEAIIVAKSLQEVPVLFEKYIYALPEPITSKLDNEGALRTHVLSSIASGYVFDVKGMFEFLNHTFMAHQKKTANLLEIISSIFSFLEKHQMIKKEGFRFSPTAFGSCISRLYLDPLSGIILREGLQRAKENKNNLAIGFLHLICCCPDMGLLGLSRKDGEELQLYLSSHQPEFLLTQENSQWLDDYFFYIATVKTSWMLDCWVNEEREEELCDRFSIGPGDVRRHIEAAEWLGYAAATVAELFKMKNEVFLLECLRKRIVYGIKEELLELVDLRGIGRIRSRSLFKKGIRRISDLKFSDEKKLAEIEQIGPKLAKDIIRQALAASQHHPAKLHDTNLLPIIEEEPTAERH
ncbi:MAG: DEAD/DEAH box helicase [Candidatus Omnitrophota bacterium]